MSRPRGVAVLGGSFDHLHAGHRALLDAAFRAGARVGIGVTSEAYLRAQRKPFAGSIQSFRQRRASVERYLRLHYSPRRWWVTPLDDGWGRSVEAGVDVLVASPETAAGAERVNQERRRRGLPPLRVVLAPLVRGADGLPISARRIRAGDIDREGRRRRPIRIAVRVIGAADLGTLRPELRHRLAPLAVSLTVQRARAGISREKGARQSAVETAAVAARRAEYGLAYVPSTGRRTGWLALADREGGVAAASIPRAGDVGAALSTLWRVRRLQRKVITSGPALRR